MTKKWLRVTEPASSTQGASELEGLYEDIVWCDSFI